MTKEKKPSLRMMIYQLIKEKRGNKVHSGDIEAFGLLNKYKASTADRRARDLVEKTRKVKGVEKPNPHYCSDIESFQENGSTVYIYVGDPEPEEPQPNPLNYRCIKCSEDAVTFLDSKPVCQAHSERGPLIPGLF
jgi:hypothetical protein